MLLRLRSWFVLEMTEGRGCVNVARLSDDLSSAARWWKRRRELARRTLRDVGGMTDMGMLSGVLRTLM